MPKIKLFLLSVALAGVFTASVTFAAQSAIQTDPQSLTQVASVLESIQKALRSLAAAVQSLSDNAKNSSGPTQTSLPPAAPPPVSQPTPPPAPPPSQSQPALSPPPPASPTANELLIKQLEATLKRLQEQVAAQKPTSASAPQAFTPPSIPPIPQTRIQSNLAVSTLTRPDGTIVRVGDPNASEKPTYAPDIILVKMARGFTPDGVLSATEKERIKFRRASKLFPGKDADPNLGGIFKVDLALDASASLAVEEFNKKKSREVIYAEFNYLAETSQAPFQLPTPNDPLYPQEWHLPKVSARQAWGVTQGSSNVVIAVIDTGVRWSHPDLAANIWHNPGEIPNNGIDDDRNGFIDDDKGWDFVETTMPCWSGEDCDTEDKDPGDFYGHGTHVAGIAAAVTNNNIGVAGICQRCKIMNVRAGFAWQPSPTSPEPGGVLEYDDIAQGLAYAADNGAKVISMSFGGGDEQVMRDAIRYAYSRGAVLVGAAGNSAWANPAYPAGYPEVIAVAATDQNDQRAFYSNYGSWVDVAAPGNSILSTVIPGVQWGCRDTMNGYGYCAGTSMATPLVSGVIGLAFSRYPSLTQNQAYTLVHSSADAVAETRYIGTGRINAFKTVQSSAVPLALFDSALNNTYVTSSITLRGTAAGQGFARYRVEFGQGAYPTSWTVIQGDTATPVTNGILATWDPRTSNLAGEYEVRLLVTDTNNRTWEDRTTLLVDTTLAPGWPKRIPGYPLPRQTFWHDNLSPPTLVDVDSDGDGEMFFQALPWNPSLTSYYAIDHQGALLPGAWPVLASPYSSYFSRVGPAVADVDGDRIPEIIHAHTYYDPGLGTQLSKLFVYRLDGTLKPGWPVTINTAAAIGVNSPVIANVDGGRDLEIIIGTVDWTFNPEPSFCNRPGNKMFVYKQNGQLLPGWPRDLACPPEATPAAGDIDGDGTTEIVVSTGGSDDANPNPLYVFRSDGTLLPGWPQSVGGYTPPALADIDLNDGGKLEVLVVAKDRKLYVLNHDGSTVPGWPLQLTSPRGQVVGDLNNDGRPEIVVPDFRKLYAFDWKGQEIPGWAGGKDIDGFFMSFPVIADLDGDGQMEVVTFSLQRGINRLYGFHANGSPIAGFPKVLASNMESSYPTSAAVGDFNGNGLIDLFVLDNSEDGYMYLWEFSGPATPQALPWPMFHGNPQHTGRYVPYVPQQ